MLKTLLVYILVTAGIVLTMGMSGAAHITEHALQRLEYIE